MLNKERFNITENNLLIEGFTYLRELDYSLKKEIVIEGVFLILEDKAIELQMSQVHDWAMGIVKTKTKIKWN
jgi:hypothetical protein